MSGPVVRLAELDPVTQDIIRSLIRGRENAARAAQSSGEARPGPSAPARRRPTPKAAA